MRACVSVWVCACCLLPTLARTKDKCNFNCQQVTEKVKYCFEDQVKSKKALHLTQMPANVFLCQTEIAARQAPLGKTNKCFSLPIAAREGQNIGSELKSVFAVPTEE